MSLLKLDGAVSAAASFTFTGNTGILDIGAPTGFAGVIGGMKVGKSTTVPTTELNTKAP